MQFISIILAATTLAIAAPANEPVAIADLNVSSGVKTPFVLPEGLSAEVLDTVGGAISAATANTEGLLTDRALQKRACGACSDSGQMACWECYKGYCHYYLRTC